MMFDKGSQLSRRAALKRISGAAAVGGLGFAGGVGSAGATETDANFRATEITSTEVTFAWDDVGAGQYYLYWQNSNSDNSDYREVSGTEATQQLSSGTTYYVWLGVSDGSGFSWQGPLRVTTERSDPQQFIEDVEANIHDRVNDERANNGVPALDYNGDLATVARDHSQYQAEQGEIMHVQEDGDTVGDRLDQDGITCTGWGENVLQNNQADQSAADAAAATVQLWMDSTGHRENILNGEFTQEGVGIAITDAGELYATQVFGEGCQ
jgi:uncharacterized protein YkwD